MAVLEGPNRHAQLVRFYALMGFSSVIASLGVLLDSTATVIGAMLIAPLMTPLMATSLALVSGRAKRLAGAGMVVLSGVPIPVLVGALVSATIGRGVDPATNTQMVSRSNPTLLDLTVALAAGGAGAYALSRRDVSDSLPGVAIALSLVPPLAVVGVAAQLQDWGTSGGALLLFVTNALAIVAMGSLMFVVTGVASAAASFTRDRVGHWVVGFAAAGLAVLAGLIANSASINVTGAETAMSRRTVEQWADELGYEVDRVTVDGDAVDVRVIGAQGVDERDAGELADQLGTLLGEVTLHLSVDLREEITVTGG